MSTRSGGTTAADLLRADATRIDVRTVLVLPAAAVITALAAGAVIMLATGIDIATIGRSFVALLDGSVGSANAVSETLTAAAPLILAGLGVAIGFRAGLFNIGAEGQLLMGGMASLVIGFSLTGLPLLVHLPLALVAGAAAGALWGSIAGWLRASTGAHEVITTIMLNFIALRLVDYLLRNPPIQKPGRNDPISKSVLDSASLPGLLDWLGATYRVNAGILLALLMTVVVAWFMFRSTIGFEFRAAGASPDTARYAGVRIGRTIVAAMAAGGALAGLAGATQVLGVLGRASPGFSAGLGLRGDRRRPAGPLSPGRRAAGGAPVRSAGGRRAPDAGAGRRKHRSHHSHSGADRHLRRGTAAGPATLSVPASRSAPGIVEVLTPHVR